MPRKAAVTPNRHLHTTVPAELIARLDLFLWSEVEGRVPQGAYQQFICESIRSFFSERTLDLAAFLPEAIPGQFLVKASPETLHTLTNLLKGKSHGPA